MRSYPMIKFFKDMLMMKDDEKKIGLSQFKTLEPVDKPKISPVKPASEVKLSDLMRRSYN